MMPETTYRDDKDRLVTELALYADHKAEWLRLHRGQFVVIQGLRVLGFYDSWEDAFRAGVEGFGIKNDFLVRQVLAREPIYFIY